MKRIFLIRLCDYAGDIDEHALTRELVRDFLVDEIARLIRKDQRASIPILVQSIKELVEEIRNSTWRFPLRKPSCFQ